MNRGAVWDPGSTGHIGLFLGQNVGRVLCFHGWWVGEVRRTRIQNSKSLYWILLIY